MSPRRTSRFRFAASALTLIASLPAHALDYVWAGGGGAWNDPAMWSWLGVPGADDSASIHFTSTSAVFLTEPTAVGVLRLTAGARIGGAQTLEIGEFIFDGGALGAAVTPPGGSATVRGATHINGLIQLGIDWTQTLNLLGNSHWGAGNGTIGVGPAYSNSAGSFGTSQLTIGNGTRFEDLGAASAGGTKSLGYYGGIVRNEGTYVRTGLGTTVVTSFDNRGTIEVREGTFAFSSSHNSSSSGSIDVASGATLALGSVAITGGEINNRGQVLLSSGRVTVADTARIGGIWQIDANNQVATLSGNHTLQSLTMNGGRLSAAGNLTLGNFVFNFGALGDVGSLAPGLVTVTGATTINGTNVLAVEYAQSLTLQGDAHWSAGNGRLSTANAYYQGQQYVVESTLRIGSGTVFTDLGAADGNGWKRLGGGGTVVNDGTYLRDGVGSTLASRFINNGVVQVRSGTFAVDAQWQNLGRTHVASGALLAANAGTFVNAGTISGSGIVRPFSQATIHALRNQGTLAPSIDGAAGTLTIDGALHMVDGAVLQIDLFGSSADRLVVAGGVTWGGELALSGDLALRDDGEATSFVIASYGQLLANSSFDRITWNGVEAANVTLEYGGNELTLRVSAVPEPGAWALLLAGLGVGMAGRRQRLAA